MNLPRVNIYLTKQCMKYSTPPPPGVVSWRWQYSRRFTFHWAWWTVHHCSWNVVWYTWLLLPGMSQHLRILLSRRHFQAPVVFPLWRYGQREVLRAISQLTLPSHDTIHRERNKRLLDADRRGYFSPKTTSDSIWAPWFQKSCVILGFGIPWPCGKKCKTPWTRPLPPKRTCICMYTHEWQMKGKNREEVVLLRCWVHHKPPEQLNALWNRFSGTALDG